MNGHKTINELYYPTVEVYDNDEWINLSLLYKDSITFILPEGTRNHLSDIALKIQSSGIIDYYEPKKSDINRISTDFKETVDNILEYCENSWLKNEILCGEKNNLILKGKINGDIYEYLCSKNLVIPTHSGLMTSKCLGAIFMEFLAENIAERSYVGKESEQKKYILTTDDTNFKYINSIFEELESYSKTTRDCAMENANFEYVKTFLLKRWLPDREVDLDKLIDLRRNNRTFELSRKAFNDGITNLPEELINGNELKARTITSELIDIQSEIKSLIEGLGAGSRQEFVSYCLDAVAESVIPGYPLIRNISNVVCGKYENRNEGAKKIYYATENYKNKRKIKKYIEFVKRV
ncbi:Hypothetical protein Tpal_664 [Trichococcus palustris]|uniref:Uncharacterized protein n=1 Tax=Trichococcus palustris TaxID=140314 RepID=A0A143YCS2_9LACT|nr:hypothetical protein [Trichococcus palustris]CZQ85662.1 Hypothetical protein Tpal_664 [Trichococcus palustris]SFK56530.1 hypothetical protein SAMN04488076_101147 [Trichococcus palustris]